MAKLISWGKDRNESIARIKRALAEYQISGVISNIPLFSKIVNHNKFTDCSYTINTLVNEIVNNGGQFTDKEHLEEIAALISTLLNDK